MWTDSVSGSTIVTIYSMTYPISTLILKFKQVSGFALGFIFLSPSFSPIRFFLCHFLDLRARFLAIFCQKRARFGGIFRKKCLPSLTPYYCTHIDKITKE